MKTLRIGFALCMGVLGGMLLAQTESDLPDLMKQVSASSKAIKGAKDLPAIHAEAAKMEAAYAKMEAVFAKANVAGAAKLAADAKIAAAATAKATTVEAAMAASAGATGACGGCHPNFREKGDDGKFRLKH
jgi:mono/diheme cytochrome c family protein